MRSILYLLTGQVGGCVYQCLPPVDTESEPEPGLVVPGGESFSSPQGTTPGPKSVCLPCFLKGGRQTDNLRGEDDR